MTVAEIIQHITGGKKIADLQAMGVSRRRVYNIKQTYGLKREYGPRKNNPALKYTTRNGRIAYKSTGRRKLS